LARRDEVVELRWRAPPRPRASFGLSGDWVAVGDEANDASALLLVPFAPDRIGWLTPGTLRLFYLDREGIAFEKIRATRRHRKHSVIYAKVNKAGTYGLIGLHRHPLVRQTIQLLCELAPAARAMPPRGRLSLRDRVCEVALCARDLQPELRSAEGRAPLLSRPADAGETICDRCHGVEIVDLPECHILKERVQPSESPLAPGPFKVGFRLIADIPVSPELDGLSGTINGVTFSTPVRNTAVVFYPATADRENAPVASGSFRLLIVGHAKRFPGTSLPTDTRQDFRQVSALLGHLAGWGFVCIAPDISWLVSNLGHRQRVALEDAGRHMAAEHSRAGSPFEGRISTAGRGLIGHSAGGWAAILAGASGELSIDATALIAPAADAEALSNIAAFSPRPVLVFHGTADTSSLGNGDRAFEIFDAANAPKHLVVIGGANHFGYTDGISSGLEPADISREDQQRIAKAFLTAFFRRYLRGVAAAADYLTGDQTIEGLEAFDITVEAEL
jgi:dienelactone hydrolase